MTPLTPRFYDGLWKWLSPPLILLISVAGFFWPAAGLAVPVLILAALGFNAFGRRSFCAGVCPNGRALSASFTRLSRGKPLPRVLRSPMARNALCAFMLFCVINLLSRTGGEWALVGRVFWLMYTVSVGLGAAMALFWKPRAWCAVCPMGTLQDTLGSGARKKRGPVL